MELCEHSYSQLSVTLRTPHQSSFSLILCSLDFLQCLSLLTATSVSAHVLWFLLQLKLQASHLLDHPSLSFLWRFFCFLKFSLQTSFFTFHPSACHHDCSCQFYMEESQIDMFFQTSVLFLGLIAISIQMFCGLFKPNIFGTQILPAPGPTIKTTSFPIFLLSITLSVRQTSLKSSLAFIYLFASQPNVVLASCLSIILREGDKPSSGGTWTATLVS